MSPVFRWSLDEGRAVGAEEDEDEDEEEGEGGPATLDPLLRDSAG